MSKTVSKTVKKIRKVVTHVHTGRRWDTMGVPYSPEKEEEYVKWLFRILSGETTAFTMSTGLNDKHVRQTLFNAELLKQCVVEIEVYEDSEE